MAKTKKKYDFSGWATKYGLRCSDGVTLAQNAFQDEDGQTVSLVWNHSHNDLKGIIGQATLEHRDSGVYAYCSFNNTENAKIAKELVKNGDVSSLSIFANNLTRAKDKSIITHGTIREVSLVISGANPGARIDNVLMHSAFESEDPDYNQIFNLGDSELEVVLEHSDQEGADNIMAEEQKPNPVDPNAIEHASGSADGAKGDAEKTVADVFNTLNEEQKTVVYAIIGQVMQDNKAEVKQSAIKEGEGQMSNVFEQQKAGEQTPNNQQDSQVLTHDLFMEILADAKKCGSLKQAFIEHGFTSVTKEEYISHAAAGGITNIGNLYPEAALLPGQPTTVDENSEWVSVVMGGIRKSPMAKIKTEALDVRDDNARAKGYTKGNKKTNSIVVASKRVTEPTTVYIKHEIDRDDVIDIVDFDVVAWIKNYMRGKLDKEIARAILMGDGRAEESDDKINETHIRPVLSDSEYFTIKKNMERGTDDKYVFAKKFIREFVESQEEYKGSGNLTMFVPMWLRSAMLLIEDTNGHRIYKTEQELATALLVKRIVAVPEMKNVVRTDDAEQYDYKAMCIALDLADYTSGANKGGAVSMFDDFDIDYNQYKYLMEGRCSGALTKLYSAIVFEEKVEHVSAAE